MSRTLTGRAATYPTRDLSALFDPRSVAVVGASDDEGKYGNWLAVQALRMADARDVYLVNRRGGRVLGRPAARRLQDLAAPVDLVVVTVPAAGFEAAVEDALEVGARAIVGVTSGFAESGAAGQRVQDRVVRRARAAGAVLVGPNCLGVYDSSTELTLTSNPMPAGGVALLSQSGNMALELSNSLAARGHGFSRFVSLGNQADLDIADLIEDCARHDETGVIAVYCEDFKDGRRFVAAAGESARLGKPVVLLTVGGSEASIRGAKSHTGSLTTRSSVVDAACEAAGVYRVRSPRELVSAASTLLRFGTSPVRRLAVVADGGGHASVASDLVDAVGVDVPAFGPVLCDRLAGLLPTSVALQNPVDVGSGSSLSINSFCTVTAALLDDENVDAVLVTGYFGGYEHYGPSMAREELATARLLGDLAATGHKPVLIHTMFPHGTAARELTQLGVPVFAAIDDATDCLQVLSRRLHPRRVPDPAQRPVPITDASYWGARELLRSAGVGFPAARLVVDLEEAVSAAQEIGFPVTLKAMGLLHKSDVGGVVLGLGDPAQLSEAWAMMETSLAPPAYSVEAMADLSAGPELIVGAQVDPRFGAVVTVGLGGLYAEVLADVCHALAPVDEATALSMLARLRSTRALDAFRGRPALNRDAAARAIATVSALAAAHREVAELEINPLLVTESGAVALDARLVLYPPEPAARAATSREERPCTSH
ncbi:acetate--CoA ligase family protein [soil metagenome]